MEPHSGLNNLDYIVIGIILFSGLLALMRGFVREMFSLVAWIGAYFAAVKLYPLAIPTMHHYIKNDKAAEWGAMAVIYVVTLVVLIALGSLIAHYAIRGRALTSIDRSLGFLYGALRGAVVVCLIYLGAVMVLWPDIDKPPQAAVPVTVTTTGVNADSTVQQGDKDRNVPPDMLLEAKTRPLLAFGGRKLAVFIPKDMIDKTIQNLTVQKNGTQKDMDQKTLDMLSTPAPQPRPTTGDTSEQHLDINRAIDLGGKP